jgi:hypothetical protein
MNECLASPAIPAERFNARREDSGANPRVIETQARPQMLESGNSKRNENLLCK